MTVPVYSSLNLTERNAAYFLIKIPVAKKQRNIHSDVLPFLKNNGSPRTLTELLLLLIAALLFTNN